ncbi:MAG: hypothetical protein GOV01_00885 [Candidatus Altiarchaeota archaeon]|nr:hypothetical protein [Candidatus Altiarchaeota archaeon]
MSDVAELKKKFNSLKKKYPELPDFKEFSLIFGFPKDDEFDSVLRLYISMKKTPLNVAHWIIGQLSPVDTISSHDNKFAKTKKTELLEAMKTCMVIDKQLSLVSFESARTDDPEKLMASAISQAVSDLMPHVELFEVVLRLSMNGWMEESKSEEYGASR